MKRFVTKSRNKIRQARHARIRKTVIGCDKRPRLSVFRSLLSIKLQLIDDNTGKTLCAVDSKEIKDAKHETLKGKIAQAYFAGKLLAQKAQEKKITEAVFDRGGYKYHGRVKAAAEGAREGGLKF
jgi:large subunit ribosomal protein L18